MKYGYIRVSRQGGDETSQRQAIVEEGVNPMAIYTDNGRKRDEYHNGTGLSQVLEVLKRGDQLYFYAIDRIGESILDNIRIIRNLKERGIVMVSIKEGKIDPDSHMGKVYFVMASLFAELERDRIGDRLGSGYRAKVWTRSKAEAAGVDWADEPPEGMKRCGRKPYDPTSVESQLIVALHCKGYSISQIADQIGWTKARTGRYVKRMKDDKWLEKYYE